MTSGTLTTLHSFDGTDGAGPWATLVQGTDENFYGTTVGGGANGDGTVFKITPSGTLTSLHSFCSQSGWTDGYDPYNTSLVQATDGSFYGGTALGGANDGGTTYKITPSGVLTTLFSLGASGLIQDTNGILYGTTYAGGTGNCPPHGGFQIGGCGTVFSLNVGLSPFVETKPTSGKVGTVVNILGSLLTGATSVTFNGTAAAFTVESGSLIKTTVPAGATSGTVKVIKPHGTVSSNVPFTVIP